MKDVIQNDLGQIPNLYLFSRLPLPYLSSNYYFLIHFYLCSPPRLPRRNPRSSNPLPPFVFPQPHTPRPTALLLWIIMTFVLPDTRLSPTLETGTLLIHNKTAQIFLAIERLIFCRLTLNYCVIRQSCLVAGPWAIGAGGVTLS